MHGYYKRLSGNFSSFDGKENIMKNYIRLVKKEINEKSPVIIIDNSDITKTYSKKNGRFEYSKGIYKIPKFVFYCPLCTLILL